jgi:drug/metabolite transporter (DMT)-like permease
MNKRKYATTGVEALFLAAFFYAGTNALVRYMSPMWGDQAQVFARFAVAGLILLIINRFRKEKVKGTLKGKTEFAIALSLLQSLAILFYTLAVIKTSIANMLFVSFATTMIVQFLLGTIVLREKVSRSKIIAIVLSLIGLALYSHSLISGNTGILFSVLAGIVGAFANLMNKKLADADRWAVLEVQYCLGAIFLFGITLALGGDFIRIVSLGGILITIVFAITILIASYLLLYGYKRVDVNIGTVISSTELVFGVVLGLLLFSELPNIWEMISGVFITTGAVVGALGQNRDSPNNKNPDVSFGV